jgi:hypothetical protein
MDYRHEPKEEATGGFRREPEERIPGERQDEAWETTQDRSIERPAGEYHPDERVTNRR